MPASVASTRLSGAWIASEVAIPVCGAAPIADQCAPRSADLTTSLAWVSPAGLVALVHTRTRSFAFAASRAPVGWPLAPGAPGRHRTCWLTTSGLATVQPAPVSGPLTSSPSGAPVTGGLTPYQVAP